MLTFALAALLACGPGGETPGGETPGGEPRSPAPDGAPSDPAAGPDTAGPGPAPSDSVPGGAAPTDWTAGLVDVPSSAAGVATLRAVRAARHEGWDRVVWEFTDGRPGVHVEYVDEPVRECGSGHPVELPGDGWLEVRMEPAAAHEDGASTIDGRRLEPALPTVLEAALTCDFEAVVTWVLAASSPEPYRVRVLSDPARIVVDVRHPAP